MAKIVTDSFLSDVIDQLAYAESKHKPLNSLHEAYSVLLEEVDELWEEVKKRTDKRDLGNVRLELVQIATMAWRAARDLGLSPKEPTRAA